MKPTITYDDFAKLDIRSGTILAAGRVPKSEKLLQLEVSFGSEVGNRVILAGIGKDFEPETLIGTSVVAVLNLAPRKMMGIESHGMLLAGHGEKGLSLVQCTGVAPGGEIG